MNNVKNYQTKQKVIILDLLQRNQSVHLTVEQMLTILKNEETPVGKTTLYRFLESMIEQGEVQKYTLDNMTSCYQYIGGDEVHNHYHLKCNCCTQIFYFLELLSFHEKLIESFISWTINKPPIHHFSTFLIVMHRVML